MELFDLEQGAKAVSCGGHVLNCQELTGLQVGLTMLKTKEKFPGVYLWGKIFGVPDNYYIAYAIKDAEAPELEFPVKVFFYANEDFEFKPLPGPSKEKLQRIRDLTLDKPFTGKVDASIEPVLEEAVQDEANADGGDEGDKLTERDRLGQVVLDIDFDTAAVPRGAHRLNEAHMVVPSADFCGLNMTEATSLDNYVHFRPPSSVAELRAFARTDAEFYANFFNSLEGDLPKGCWAVRQDLSAGLVTLRSLSWRGYIAYHIPQTNKYGGLYYGSGQKSRELPFLL